MAGHRKPTYAICPGCGKKIAVTRAGHLRQHRNPDRTPGAPWECPQRVVAVPPPKPAVPDMSWLAGVDPRAGGHLHDTGPAPSDFDYEVACFADNDPSWWE